MSGEAADRFDRPFSGVLDSSNTLYISDQNNNRVQKWLAGASTGTTVVGQASTVAGMDSNSLDNPSGVLLDSSGNIYVADTNNFRIQYWPQGASSGTTIAGITDEASINSICTKLTIVQVTQLLTLHKSMDDFDNQVTLALIKRVSDLLKE
ncbi:unnamed protein product [Rotaria sordida]|uniref:NHL repeat containing protein n=1 Tax=Rotaria sordida TaxID=392033 RepID=A0A814IK33_9BILA|nr:unnamed protein product [Rotaria sordida]CAF3675996.1 unnamed protein product [Rotaria sordida]CAF4062900.1 unnamed protein product [Rotaria sordida]